MSRAVLRLRSHITGLKERTAAIPKMLTKRSSCLTDNMRLLTVPPLKLVSKNIAMDVGMNLGASMHTDMGVEMHMKDMESMGMMESRW